MKQNQNQKQSAHTPGPWHSANGVYHLGERELIGIGNGAEHIGYASITACVRLAEAKANARLIAAAPELLESLQALVEAYDLPAADYIGQMRDAIEQARSALARARGEDTPAW